MGWSPAEFIALVALAIGIFNSVIGFFKFRTSDEQLRRVEQHQLSNLRRSEFAKLQQLMRQTVEEDRPPTLEELKEAWGLGINISTNAVRGTSVAFWKAAIRWGEIRGQRPLPSPTEEPARAEYFRLARELRFAIQDEIATGMLGHRPGDEIIDRKAPKDRVR